MEYDDAWIYSTLTNIGYRLFDCGDQWRSHALFRGGDNQSALVIYKKSGVWKDYAQDSEHMPLTALLEQSVGKGKASEILGGAKVYQGPSTGQSTLLKMHKVYDPSSLSRLIPHHLFYTRRGISVETLKKVKAGFSTGGAFYQRYTFPLYSDIGQIIAWSGRHVFWEEESKFVKWKHLGPKQDSCWPLFVPDFNECEEQIDKTGVVVLVESIGDSLALIESGVPNNLVLFGLGLAPKTITELIRLAPKKIVVALNKDEKENGQIATCKVILKLLNYFSPSTISINTPLRNDVGNMLTWGDDIKSWAEPKETDVFGYLDSYKNRLPKKYQELVKKLKKKYE